MGLMFGKDLIIFLMVSYPIWLVIRSIVLIKKITAIKLRHEWIVQLFALYLLIVIFLTLRPFSFQIPFIGPRSFYFDYQLFYQLSHMADGYLHLQLLYSVGNILMFIPYGMLGPFIFNKLCRFYWMMLTSFLFSLSIELIQGLFTLTRRATMDDLVFNTAGAIIGYCFYLFIKRMVNKEKQVTFLTNDLTSFTNL